MEILTELNNPNITVCWDNYKQLCIIATNIISYYDIIVKKWWSSCD